MCSAAHAWVGLGRIVYVSSSEQLTAWLAELGVAPPPVRALPVNQVAPGLVVQGPVPGLDEQVRQLHRRFRRLARPGWPPGATRARNQRRSAKKISNLYQEDLVADVDPSRVQHLGVDARARLGVGVGHGG